MVSEDVVKRLHTLCKNAKSPESQVSVSVGFIADALGFDRTNLFLGRKTAVEREAAELRAENQRLQAQLAAATAAEPLAAVAVEEPTPTVEVAVEEPAPAAAEPTPVVEAIE